MKVYDVLRTQLGLEKFKITYADNVKALVEHLDRYRKDKRLLFAYSTFIFVSSLLSFLVIFFPESPLKWLLLEQHKVTSEGIILTLFAQRMTYFGICIVAGLCLGRFKK